MAGECVAEDLVRSAYMEVTAAATGAGGSKDKKGKKAKDGVLNHLVAAITHGYVRTGRFSLGWSLEKLLYLYTGGISFHVE